MAGRMKLVIDCDTGVDDAVALLLALNHHQTAEILAITCVNGNCSVDEAVRNTLITLKVAQQVVPVYRGCSKPLFTVEQMNERVHGVDGLGGVANEFTPCEESLQSGHAVNVLVDLVNKYPGEVTLVSLGPLTNVAMAYRLDEQFSSKLKKMVIMGGNHEGRGNTALAAEFNFMTDPEAAQIVVEETVCPCQVIGWEVCGVYSRLPWEWYDAWIKSAAGITGNFVKKIVAHFASRIQTSLQGKGFNLCDPIAMAVALHPDMVIDSTHRKVTVETSGTYTRGMMAIEWVPGLFPRSGTKPVEIITKFDIDKQKSLLESVVI